MKTQNKNKPGYKKTKLGWIPEEWIFCKMKNICNVNQGLQIPISQRYNEPGNDRKLYITIQYLKGGSEAQYIENPTKNVCCNESDILLTRTGNTGIVVSNISGVFHNNFFKISYDRNKLEKNYLLYFLNFNKTQNLISKLAGTSTIPDINHNDFYNIPIPLPPLPEQKAIADLLTTWDEAIEKTERLILAKENLKKGLMQKLLTGRVRFPEFIMKEKHKKNKAGKEELPEGWIVTQIIDLLQYERPDNYIVEDYDKKSKIGTPVLTANKSFILGYTTNKEKIYQNYPVIIFDDFTVDNKYVNFDFSVKSSAIKILKTKDKKNNLKYIFELMQVIKFPIGDHKRYYISEYQYVKVNIPPLKEQTRIATVLSTVDKEIDLLKKKLESLKQQKKGLMQKLLTGEVRVKA